MNDRVTLSAIKSRFSDEDLLLIKLLRNYYRRHFHSGANDESFLLWLKYALRILDTRTTKQRLDASAQTKERNYSHGN